MRALFVVVLAALAPAPAACGSGDPPPCESNRLPFRNELHCEDELRAQAARPLDAALPGAITVKTIIDRATPELVYFQDTETYTVHSRFAIENLGWSPGAPFVDQYYSPSRRFILGSITYYEEPGVFAYEIAPYDTADNAMIAMAFHALADAAYFGAELKFHPTSEEQLARAAELPPDVPVITTDELFAGISYQPLNLGETYAQVHVLTAAELATTYVGPREIAVLDRAPNDISVVAAVVTQELQTPLSHVNVLSQQRGTPNMGLRDAPAHFAPLDGRWVRLAVGAFAWEVEEVTAEAAEAWWQDHLPPPAVIPEPDYTVTTVQDVDDIGLANIAAIGGKAAHYGALRDIGDPVRVRDALAIPVVFYRDFLADNGFDARIAEMLADETFRNDGNARKAMLADLQADMIAAPVDAADLAAIEARLEADFPSTRMKFRSSTNAEDLANHSGAGLYASKAGQVGDLEDPVDLAVKTVWASTWNFRAFEERAYVSIDHTRVAMAVLVTPSFQDEAANGVAITANVFDPAPGGEDAFFVNAQVGEISVVQPDPGVVADSMMYYWYHPNQPATYYTKSNLVPVGTTVMTRSELFELGQALDAIRGHFRDDYDPPDGYGQLPMDVEWKLVDEGGTRRVWIKQARFYPGRGADMRDCLRSTLVTLCAATFGGCGGGSSTDPDAAGTPDADIIARTTIGGVEVLEQRALTGEPPDEWRYARVTAQFFAAGPARFHRFVAEEGGCTLRAYTPASCDPVCLDGLCVDNTCEPWPTYSSAGTLTITGLTTAVSITPESGYYAYYDPLPEDLFADDATVTARLAGDEIPAATLTAGGVRPLATPITDRITLVPGEDHTVTWTPDGGGHVRLTINANNQGHGGPYLGIIECLADDSDGSITVPAALVDQFPETRAWTVCAGSDCPPSWLRRYHETPVPVGTDQQITLTVATEQAFGVDHILE